MEVLRVELSCEGDDLVLVDGDFRRFKLHARLQILEKDIRHRRFHLNLESERGLLLRARDDC